MARRPGHPKTWGGRGAPGISPAMEKQGHGRVNWSCRGAGGSLFSVCLQFHRILLSIWSIRLHLGTDRVHRQGGTAKQQGMAEQEGCRACRRHGPTLMETVIKGQGEGGCVRNRRNRRNRRNWLVRQPFHKPGAREAERPISSPYLRPLPCPAEGTLPLSAWQLRLVEPTQLHLGTLAPYPTLGY